MKVSEKMPQDFDTDFPNQLLMGMWKEMFYCLNKQFFLDFVTKMIIQSVDQEKLFQMLLKCEDFTFSFVIYSMIVKLVG